MKITMKESIVDIQLMNGPRLGKSNVENCPNGPGIHHEAKCLIAIHTCNLLPTITYKTSLIALKRTIRFIALKRTIRFFLMAKNPHAANNVSLTRAEYQRP